tara:strand:+ start:9608 stop:10327 length:720 start_codon:yes stop_codon:yes gene_type:complete
MIIFPAIDIKEGKCVRLLKGDFNKITQYKKMPSEQAEEFVKLGFKNLHLVDLDGALEGKIINKDIIKKIAKISNIKIQVGGGVRSEEHIEQLVNVGVDTVIIGTAAVENIEFLKNACKNFKKKIAVSLDVRNGYIALSGWKKQTKILASDFIKNIEDMNISKIIYTDINRDGTKQGANLSETLNFSNLTKIPVIISGGISSMNEVISIKEKKYRNITGIIIGKAIYDGSININELSKII